MEFEWDEKKKRGVNIKKHKIDFIDIVSMFDAPLLEWEDKKHSQTERRIAALGKVGGTILYAVYTWRGENRRLISVRKAKDREKRIYYASYPRTGEADEGED